jgi:lipid-binding SYLF domain-containing protein
MNMKQMNRFGLWLWAPMLLVGLALPSGSAVGASKKEKEKAELTEQVKETISQFEKADEGIRGFFKTSAGYAVFPKVAKGGLGVGAAHGSGQLFEKGQLVGETKLTQVTVGLQLGGQVYGEVIFFETAETLKNFKEGNVEFSAQVSAVAAAEGASKNAKYELGVLVFTIAKGGLMYEASVGGQKFKYEPYEQAKGE